MITYDELKKTTAKGATLLKVDDSVLTVYGVFDDEAGKYAIFEDETHALRRAHADYLGVFDDLAFSCAENSNYQDETTDSFQAYLDAKRKEQEDADGTSKVRAFRDIVTGMADLYAKKNKDYGDSFGQSFKEYGAYASTQRLHDKLNRIKQLLKSGDAAVKTESVIDTLTDLACYAIMLRIEIEQQNK
jgi:hypothetical protein